METGREKIEDVLLQVFFTPEAIREHFADDPAVDLSDITDRVLAEVGRDAMTDDLLWATFHTVLEDALARL